MLAPIAYVTTKLPKLSLHAYGQKKWEKDLKILDLKSLEVQLCGPNKKWPKIDLNFFRSFLEIRSFLGHQPSLSVSQDYFNFEAKKND